MLICTFFSVKNALHYSWLSYGTFATIPMLNKYLNISLYCEKAPVINFLCENALDISPRFS